MPTIPASKEKYVITPHPDAPVLSNVKDAELHIKQLLSEVSSPNASFYGEVTNLLREAGLVNLFFFLRCIASFSGPYERLTDHLHLDACNFRQLNFYKGARAAAIMPRGFFKSTSQSHGADSWILNRDPNQRIAVVNAIVDKAYDFYKTSRGTFEANDFFAYLYPGNVVKSGKAEFVLPSRTRRWPEPSLKVLGATGAAEGGHYTGLNIDDLIGLDELDKEHKINANMLQKINWANTNINALLDSPISSWIMWVFTLYAADDVYHQKILDKNMKALYGYQDPDMLKKVNHEIPPGVPAYNVYYRSIIEDGKAILPEEGYTKEWYDGLLEEDRWTAMVQYANKVSETGLVEFYKLPTKSCTLDLDNETGKFYIIKKGLKNLEDLSKRVDLSFCDVVMSIDPAATDTGITAKTSRTSIGVWAMDAAENCYRIGSKVGYFDIEETFNHIFDLHKFFKGHIRATFVESNAMQKIIAPLLRKEERQRKMHISPMPIFASGDKVARIRSTVGYYLAAGKIYLATGCAAEFIEEKDIFPMSEFKRDVLDESEKGLTALRKPLTQEEEQEQEEMDDLYYEQTTDNVVGY